MCVSVVDKAEQMFCKHESLRYVVNGIFATVVHFAVLSINMQIFKLHSAALANGLASIVGISVSFVGSKYYVFCKDDGKIYRQALKFFILYACIACLHVIVLFMWSDLFGLNYQIGFLIALIIQVCMSFFGNKLIVFK